MRLDDLVGVAYRLAALDLVDILHALGDFPPRRILAVEETGIVEADEELAVAGVRALGARHRDGATHMRLAIELGLELLAGAAGSGALGASGLRHESLDDAVKNHAVVEPIAHQLLDARHMPGREVGPHLDHHLALGRVEDQGIVARLAHSKLLLRFASLRRERCWDVRPPHCRALPRRAAACRCRWRRPRRADRPPGFPATPRASRR